MLYSLVKQWRLFLLDDRVKQEGDATLRGEEDYLSAARKAILHPATLEDVRGLR